MWDEPNVELKCPNTRSSETTKVVESFRQQDGGHGSRNPLRSVQILVVVASIQMRTLKTEEEKGSVRTALVHGLADPKT